MSKTMSELLNDLRFKLAEKSSRAWEETELVAYINEGVRNIARRTEVFQTNPPPTIAVSVGTQSYNMPTDIIRINRVEFNQTGQSRRWALEYRDYNSMDEIWGGVKSIQSGEPKLFTMWGYPGATASLQIILFPVPSIGGTLTLYYYQMPAEVVGNNAVKLPDGWFELPVLYAEYVALRKDADPRWQEAKQLYEQELDSLYGLSRRWSDQAGVVTSQSGAGIPRWLYEGGY